MMRRLSTKKTLALAGLATTLAVTAATAWAAGGSSAEPTAQGPQAAAKESYNRALRNRDKAWELEAEMAAASGQEREKLAKKAEKEYTKAIRLLRSAVESDPTLYQAHSSLGYALRKLGDYEGSLAAYDRALEIQPSYAEAIEYRAEAYLGLNRLDEAKAAYMELFRTDRKRAAELMEAMQEWVAVRQADAAGVETSVIGEFSGWVEERAHLAEQTGDASGGSW